MRICDGFLCNFYPNFISGDESNLHCSWSRATFVRYKYKTFESCYLKVVQTIIKYRQVVLQLNNKLRTVYLRSSFLSRFCPINMMVASTIVVSLLVPSMFCLYFNIVSAGNVIHTKIRRVKQV